MTAYRIRACMGGQHVDTIVEADTSTSAILKVSEKVDQGEVKVTENGSCSNSVAFSPISS